MPQLDTIYIFITFLWTWFTLHLIIKQTNTLKVISNRGKMSSLKTNTTMNLPWT
uniref:ATP synthase complex subunit 8 n=1 Tax=Myrrophis chinensis TaxID=192589 RepID=D5LY48_9SAUR|nr:ATPase8 [Myrrophis chinensis]